MPSPTYVALAKTVLTGTQANVEFTGIANTYTDLVLLVSSRSDRATTAETLSLQINNDTATNYSLTDVYAYGATAYSSRTSSQTKIYNLYTDGANNTASTFGSLEIYIPNYAGSTNKVISSSLTQPDNSTSTVTVSALAGLWRNTAAITSLKLFPFSGNFVSGSRFDLYGIKNS